MIIAIVGNAPSSGSTFLADLLDSTPYSACGPEINIFSHKRLYDFHRFKRNIYQSSPTSTYCLLRERIKFRQLHKYGLNAAEFRQLVEQSRSVREFAEQFGRRFLALRGKPPEGIFFEKTPQNLSCIEEFLTHFPEGYFIFLVRNPAHVYASLLRRGIPPYIALLTWYIDAARYLPYRHHPRVISLRYEELVAAPFQRVANLLKQIGDLDIAPEEIERNYQNNDYRRFHSKKLPSWSIKEYGKIGDANRNPLPPQQTRELSRLWNTQIRGPFARRFGLAEIDFESLLKELCYLKPVQALLPSPPCERKLPARTLRDSLRLTHKWFRDFVAGDARVMDWRYYLNPIERRP